MFATRALEQLAMGTDANEEDEVRRQKESFCLNLYCSV